MDSVDEFVDRYVSEVTLDDPALLCIEDMWPWPHGLASKLQKKALTAIRERAGEMKRFKPGEEAAWILTISTRTSEWMCQHARKEPTTYHLYVEGEVPKWPHSTTVRHTSALGAFLALISQIANHVHVDESTEQDLTLAMRTLVLAGVPLGATHPHLQNAHRRSQPLQDAGDEAFAEALATHVIRGKFDALPPPYVTASVVKYPTIWRRMALDFRHVVMRRKYRKMERHMMLTNRDDARPDAVMVEPDMLTHSWSPEAVVAMGEVFDYRHRKKEHRRTYETDYARLCVEFLKRLGLWECVAKLLAEEERFHGPFVLEDCGKD